MTNISLRTSIDKTKIQLEQGRNIPWLLGSWAERTPDKIFLAWEPFSGSPSTWTYKQFHDDVEKLAANLYKRGLRAGEKVLIHMDNSPEFLLSWFSCARLGAVAVSTNTRSVARDMCYFAAHAGVVGALTQPQYAQLVSESATNIQFLVVTETDAGEPADIPPDIEYIPFAEMLLESDPCPPSDITPMTDLGIQFTSGTTSRPKAVLWTHANAVWGAHTNAMHFRLRHEDITLTNLPLFHTNAQSYSMLGTLWVGGTMVLQPKFSASRFWELSERYGCTWTSMIPFGLKALMTLPVPKHTYRMWLVAVRLEFVEELFGVPTLGLWGMTETVTQGIVEDLHHRPPHLSMGRASPAYDIAVRNDAGEQVGNGETGQLFIRGTRGVSLFKEYYGNEEATLSSFDEDGWFDTGDLVSFDEDGNLFFRDRNKDMLKVGGENVAASEIEAVILETGIVDECAVVGQKHYMLDEVPVAFVIPLPTAPDNVSELILAACRANLADFKVVRDVHIVDELPRSTLEKVAKNELRARLPEITE